jgi:hypothetical protein
MRPERSAPLRPLTELLVPQRAHQIDARGVDRRLQADEDRHTEDGGGGRAERCEVERLDAEEKRANRARADPGEAETGGEARSHEAYGFTEHERADMRAAPA